MQEHDGNWLEHSTIVDSLSCTLKDLRPGTTYRFRVRAENCHGRSEPSAASCEVRIGSEASRNQTRSEEDAESDNCDSGQLFTIRPGGDFKTRFEVHEELGKGRFGVVFRCVERDSGLTLAAKVVKCIKPQNKVKVSVSLELPDC